MPQEHVSQAIIPISFFRDVNDSGQKKPFGVRAHCFVADPDQKQYVTQTQEGKDFPENANFLYNDPMPWLDLVAELNAFFEQPYPSKDKAPLFSPTTFQAKLRWNGDGGPHKGFRCKKNATTSALLCLDADNKSGPVLHIDEAIGRIEKEGIEAVVYTTASNKDGCKFRVMIPLAVPVDPDTQQQAVLAVCRMLKVGWKSDATKNNAYSLFYVPGQYHGAVRPVRASDRRVSHR